MRRVVLLGYRLPSAVVKVDRLAGGRAARQQHGAEKESGWIVTMSTPTSATPRPSSSTLLLGIHDAILDAVMLASFLAVSFLTTLQVRRAADCNRSGMELIFDSLLACSGQLTLAFFLVDTPHRPFGVHFPLPKVMHSNNL